MHISKLDYPICKNSDFAELKALLAPYTKKAYFVGGCVRDSLLGLACYDYDIEIYGISPDDFDALMRGHGGVGVGKSFFVYKWRGFDLALPRTESKTGFGHKGFSVNLCDDERKASSRRDFSINAMMVNIFDGSMLDFYGGAQDLRRKILRVVDAKTFGDDSLRVLRAVQFASRFNLKIEPASKELMRGIDISDLSSERVRMELNKLFNAKDYTKGVQALNELGLDERIFNVKIPPSFASTANKHHVITQNPLCFLYDLRVMFGDDLKLPKGFEAILKQPILEHKSARDLLELALKMPLNSWLGLNTATLVKRAKNLGIYESKLSINIDDKELKSLSENERVKMLQNARQDAINTRLKQASSKLILGIDLGSNTLRACIMDKSANIIFDFERIVGSARNLSEQGLANDAMMRIKSAIKELKSELKEWLENKGIKTNVHYYAAATQAFRISANAAEFFKQIKDEFDIDFSIISAELEAHLTRQGVARRAKILNLDIKDALFIDLGGASTEISSFDEAKSYAFGIVRFNELALKNIDILKAFKDKNAQNSELLKAKNVAKECVKDAKIYANSFKNTSCAILTSGVPTSVAAVLRGMNYANYDAKGINGARLSLDDFSKAAKIIANAPNPALLVGQGRAELVLAGIVLLQELLSEIRVPLVIIDDGLREGICSLAPFCSASATKLQFYRLG